LACGAYLGALGWRAVRAPGAEAEADADRARPLRRGLAFGLSNPKAYPVSVAMFGALLSGYGDALDWGDFPALLAAACAGFVSADIALVACVGAGPMRRLYARHATLATRAAGVLFLGFAAQALYASVAGLLGR
jgi:threonine/homoserine/homoserine lactone efflux protein